MKIYKHMLGFYSFKELSYGVITVLGGRNYISFDEGNIDIGYNSKGVYHKCSEGSLANSVMASLINYTWKPNENT